ncbi:MAG: tRNA (adenosine(37)-N6)-dimethylallyltransferase MiaA [Deltaproteobacteria bacterium]|jgi:tRNA dimethylallyltransferase|nr:tRNA (adenosine(37)-N6)-dimethylallyltransferase MiaA [Deltaproteobacteria bacterium]
MSAVMSKPKLVIIAGPTGSGKSELSLVVAEALGGEIVNADSLAFYRHLNIGTAKPDLADRRRAPHHLIDVAEPDEDFSAADFMRLARPLVGDLWRKGAVPLAVGGTGLYLRSLVGGLFEGPAKNQAFRDELADLARNGHCLYEILQKKDPLAAAKIKPGDPARIIRALEVLELAGESIVALQERHKLADEPFDALTIVLDLPMAEIEERLRRRTKLMFEKGLLDEVEGLLARGFGPELKPMRSIGYRQCVEHLAGEKTLDETIEEVYLRSRQLAKRQRTWFRGQTKEALWLAPEPSQILETIRRFVQK